MATTLAELVAVLRLKDELSPSLDKTIKGVLGNIGGMLSFGAAVKVATDALQAQGEQEAAINKLNLALANQGQYSAATSQALIEYSSALQETTTQADEVILDAEAMFVAFGLNEEQTKKATKAALDLSAATGKDLKEAVLAIEKGIQGHTKGLAQLNITTVEGTTAQQKFESVVSQVEARVGGSAQAATQTYAGQMAVLKNQVGEVQEGLGKFLGTILDLGGGTNAAVAGLKALSNFFGSTLITVVSEARAQILEFIGGIAKTIGDFASQLAAHPWISRALGMSPETAAEIAKWSSDFQGSLKGQIATIREQGDAAAAGAGHIQAYANQHSKAVVDVEALRKAQLEHIKAIEEEVKAYEEANRAQVALLAARAQMLEQEIRDDERADEAQRALLENRVKEHLKAIDEEVAAEEEANKAQLDLLARRAKAHQDWLRGIVETATGVARAVDSIADAFAQMGVSADSNLGTAIRGMQDLAHAGEEGAKSFASFASGDIFGGIEHGVQAVIGVFNGLKNVWNGIFGHAEIMKVNDMRDAFFAAHGGFQAFGAEMAKVSSEDWAKKIFNAKTVEEFNALVKEAQGLLDSQSQAEEKLNEAVQKYGFSIDELGPKWAAQELDKKAGELLQDYELLVASGIDVNTVIEKMGPNLNEYVNTAIKAGQVIPNEMRPIIEKMIEQGQLLDENGHAFGSLEEAGIKFGESQSQVFLDIRDSVKELVDAIRQLAGLPPIHIPVTYDDPGYPTHGGPPPEEVPAYAMGTPFVPRDGLAYLHRGEAVVPAGTMTGGSTADAIDALGAKLAQMLHPNELARAFKAAGQLS